jgi:hypothetical protein
LIFAVSGQTCSAGTEQHEPRLPHTARLPDRLSTHGRSPHHLQAFCIAPGSTRVALVHGKGQGWAATEHRWHGLNGTVRSPSESAGVRSAPRRAAGEAL